jgi:hypothetical protein
MDDSQALEALKASFLAEWNEVRVALGQEPLKAVPEEICMFCGKPKEEVGALFSGFLPFIAICRDCTVVAQRAFMRGKSMSKDGGI